MKLDRVRVSIVLVSVAMLAGRGLMAQDTSETNDKNIVRDKQLAQRFDGGKKWAVLVGVNRYLDPEINELKYCVADVRLMEQVLTERCGYEARRILVLADDQKKDHLRPFRFNLDTQIRNWLLQARAGDTVLVFFSGHGFLDDRSQGFLAPKDCRKSNLALSAFRTDDLRDMLRQCKASQKVLILDCCHAGGDRSDRTGERNRTRGTWRVLLLILYLPTRCGPQRCKRGRCAPEQHRIPSCLRSPRPVEPMV